jgi:hydrogenase expression/formation protein HypE
VIQRLLGEVGGVVSMKDPTRGGLADALNEFSEKSGRGILIYEDRVIIGVVREKAEEALEFLRGTSEGRDAEIIGEVTGEFVGVAMQTAIGGKRIIPRPLGDPVPRIC